jgi:hypothetical protein
MELDNIVPFEKFKKLLEEASIPDEFSNATKFSQSLVGRGLFSILRYFKQGIDIGRLEYLKRKLENEYFAGWLRFCAIKQINIKDGTMVEKAVQKEGEANADVTPAQQQNDDVEYPFICEVMHMDYSEDNLNVLAQTISKFKEFVATIRNQMNEGDIEEEDMKELKEMLEQAELAVKYGEIKLKINKDVFAVLQPYCTHSEQQFDPEKEKIIIDLLDQVIAFLNGDAKACKDYHLTENEKKIINVLITSKNEPIKTKCQEINNLISENPPAPAQPEPEQPTQEDYQGEFEGFLLEEITSKLNPKVPIMQVLGDTLNTVPGGTSGSTTGKVKPYEYLKSIGINSVDEIDFGRCAELWSKHPEFKEGATKMVTVEGVRKIQYAAARMIFHTKQTPTYKGMTPPVGGAVDFNEDSALRSVWERKVDAVKGQWTYFLNVDIIDPFRVMNLQDAYRKRDPMLEDYYKRMNNNTIPIDTTQKIEEGGFGLKLFKEKEWKQERGLFVMQYSIGGQIYYPVLQLHNSGGESIYKYVGNIDIERIKKDDKQKDPNFPKEARNYSSCIFDINNLAFKQKGDKKFNDEFFKGDIRYVPGEQSYLLNGVYIASTNFNRINPSQSGVLTTKNTRMFYMYVRNNKLKNSSPFDELQANAQVAAADFRLLAYDKGALKKQSLNQLLVLPPKIPSAVGCFYTFESTDWIDNYFPGMRNQIFASANKAQTPIDCGTGKRLNGILSLK